MAEKPANCQYPDEIGKSCGPEGFCRTPPNIGETVAFLSQFQDYHAVSSDLEGFGEEK